MLKIILLFVCLWTPHYTQKQLREFRREMDKYYELKSKREAQKLDQINEDFFKRNPKLRKSPYYDPYFLPN